MIYPKKTNGVYTNVAYNNFLASGISKLRNKATDFINNQIDMGRIKINDLGPAMP